MDLSPAIVLPLIVALPMTIGAAMMFAMNKASDRKRVFPFPIEQMQRPPGYSLQFQITDLIWDLANAFMFIVFSGIIPLAYVGLNHFLDGPNLSIELYVVLSLVLFLFGLSTLYRKFNRLKSLKLGLEAELAVGMQLTHLSENGYRVFHDVQAEGFNIDHLVIGQNGVFAIETKGRKKPLLKNGQTKDKQYKVVQRGDKLEFPGWNDNLSIEQSTRQAKWVSKWLSKSTGEKVAVTPVLVIPGWFIEYPSKPTIPVFALKNLNSGICSLFGENLTKEKLTKICYQAEQRVIRGKQ